MTFADRARAFTYRRQRLGGAAATPAEALKDVIGVYSSHPSAPLSLFARSEPFTADDFHALKAARLPAMRGSVFLLPKETAHLAFHAGPEPGQRRDYVLKYFGLSEKDYLERRRKVVAAAKEPIDAKALRAVTGVEKGSMLVSVMCRDGVLQRVAADSLRSNALRYVATRVRKADPDEALAWLAGEYLKAFGPARPKDFEWWTGAKPKRARAALASIDTVELEDGHLLRAEDMTELEAAEGLSAGAVDVIPKWDCLTMGYAPDGRARFVDPQHQDRAYDFRGDGIGLVLVEGRAVAAWTSRVKGKRMEVELDGFGRVPKRVTGLIRDRFEEIARLLGASEVLLP